MAKQQQNTGNIKRQTKNFLKEIIIHLTDKRFLGINKKKINISIKQGQSVEKEINGKSSSSFLICHFDFSDWEKSSKYSLLKTSCQISTPILLLEV